MLPIQEQPFKKKQLPDWLIIQNGNDTSQSLDLLREGLGFLERIYCPPQLTSSNPALPSSFSSRSESLLGKIADVQLTVQQPLQNVLFPSDSTPLRSACEWTNTFLTPCRRVVNAAVEVVADPLVQAAAATQSVVSRVCDHSKLAPVCKAAKKGAVHVAEILHVDDVRSAVAKCSNQVRSFTLDYLNKRGVPPEIACETLENCLMVGMVIPFCKFSKTISKTSQLGESALQIPKPIFLRSGDLLKNHPSPMIHKERALMWEDLGAIPPINILGNLPVKLREAIELHSITDPKNVLKGTIGFEKNKLVVTVDLVISENLDFFNGICRLKELALYNRATSLEIKAYVINERLFELMNRRLGKPKTKLLISTWEMPL